jgi:uncharacterized membrane protein YfcA
MDILVVSLTALLASGLTLYTGFGLGTLLMPAFALFIPVELAVAATALVHGANSLLKGILLGRHADLRIVLRFGLPAMAAALLGAWLLDSLSHLPVLATWEAGDRTASITPLKLAMAALMAVFAWVELHPRFDNLRFQPSLLPLGGVVSGFFGGLSGHQGALRSAFLAKAGMSAPAFVGSNALIGLGVDISRLAAYAALLAGGSMSSLDSRGRVLVVAGMLAAFAGVFLGSRLLRKVTMKSLQRATGVLLAFIALLLAAGVV